MKTCLTLFSFLLLATLPFSLFAEEAKEEKKETKPAAALISEAQELLDPSATVKGRKKALTAWLETTKAEKTDLGKHGYLTALVSAKLGDTETAAKSLLETTRKNKRRPCPIMQQNMSRCSTG